MKENRLKVILCSMVAVLAIAVMLFIGPKSTNVTEDIINDLNESIKSLSGYVNKYNIPLKGEVEISANYKGAHGESFPRDFKFNYELEDNILYFSNGKGYTKLELNKELADLFKAFYKVGINDDKYPVFKVKEEENDGSSIKVKLDIDRINKFFSKEFKNAELTINKKNAVSKDIKDITLTVDDYIITIDGNKYRIMYNDQKIDISIVKNGYSLAINNTVKMNVIYEKNVDNYNIVVDNSVYSLNISENSVNFTANSESSIYNGFESTFTAKDVTVKKDKEVDYKDNPIIRYFTEME